MQVKVGLDDNAILSVGLGQCRDCSFVYVFFIVFIVDIFFIVL